MTAGESTAVFTDTSVLFNYTFEDDDGSARELILQHSCSQCASENVQSEFERVRDNREQICNEVIPYIANGNLDEFEPSNVEELSPNDRDFLENFRETISELDPAMAIKRVNRRLRQLKAGWDDLFEEPGPYVTIVSYERVGAGLVGNLSGVVENDADCRIIADAADWCHNGGCGVFITSDKDDTLGRGSTAGEQSASDTGSSGLPDSFAGFIEGDDRTLPERINDKIRNSPDYGDHCCLDFYAPREYI